MRQETEFRNLICGELFTFSDPYVFQDKYLTNKEIKHESIDPIRGLFIEVGKSQVHYLCSRTKVIIES